MVQILISIGVYVWKVGGAVRKSRKEWDKYKEKRAKAELECNP